MSEQYEPSYYEIALTGRQVLVAFVILLVCMVAAFFSGVWVGREEMFGERPAETVAETPAGLPEDAASEPVSERAEPARGEDQGSDQGPDQGLKELSFFEEQEEPAPTQPAQPAQRRREPPREGGSGAPEPAADASPEPAASEPSTNPRQTVNPSGALSGGDLVVQVLSSSDQDAAEELMERLRTGGFRVFISPVVDAGQTFYRVRVGPFEHRDEAERVEAELRRRYDLDTWITR